MDGSRILKDHFSCDLASSQLFLHIPIYVMTWFLVYSLEHHLKVQQNDAPFMCSSGGAA